MDEGGRIVGAKIDIRSINHAGKGCDVQEPLELTKEINDVDIKYTYSVKYTVKFSSAKIYCFFAILNKCIKNLKSGKSRKKMGF